MIRGLALCAGVGGIELGLHLVLGPAFSSVCYVEREAYAAAVLAARMADGWLAPAPIWSDLTTFDGRPWRGRVDLVSAGFPCQPWSSAGSGRGTEDERWIWPEIVRVVREVGPKLVFLENVPPLIVRGGLAPVLGDLADLGFDAEWALLPAAAIGAPHLRKRLFVFAWSGGGRALADAVDQRHQRAACGGRQAVGRTGFPGEHVGQAMAYANSRRLVRPRAVGGQPHPWADGRDHAARGGSELGLFPPGPDADWSGIPEWLWPSMPADREAAESLVRGVADGLAAGVGLRRDRLRAAGNGVVPQCAARAFAELLRRASADALATR